MVIPPSFGFYAILTDPVRGYDYCTRLFVDYEVAFVQLRMKDVPQRLVIDTAQKMRCITEGTKTRLIINDSPDLARAVKADGVHVGQDDVPYEAARKIVGSQAIVGISTHSKIQVQAACMLKPDYIGCGPVYATPTKKKPDPVIGIECLKEMLMLATVPVVAIGGITLKTLQDVLLSGAKNFCMVRQITTAQNPERVLREALKIYRDFVRMS